MGYFANGTEQAMYEEEYCCDCVHIDDRKGCQVMNMHFLFGHELCNKKEHQGKVMLDSLIPRNGNVNEKCTMYKQA